MKEKTDQLTIRSNKNYIGRVYLLLLILIHV